MYRKLLQSVREYKKASLLSPLFVSMEVLLECIIPFITATLIDKIQQGDFTMATIAGYGAVLVVMAVLSLICGWAAGSQCATAACGFAKNLRKDMFYKIQGFSFENIDRFHTSSLVTRLTTDVMNVQQSYMMIIRTAVRSPLMLVFSFIMAFIMGGKLALIFAVVIPIMLFGLILIARKAMPLFRSVFKKYDRLNESIQENVKGMRVVKSFVRESYETEKFNIAAGDVCADFTTAEKILAFNAPIMQFCMYFNMLAILTFGSYVVISTAGLRVGVGQLSSLLTYGFQILINLMMLSMVYVMITMSNESVRRIVEVLNEQSTITAPDHAVTELADGSVDFDNVSFRYATRAKKMALADIDLHIKSGETIGIIGGTGSSKSSLIQLISRLYDVTEGQVKVGGKNVKEYDPAVLRDGVAVVLQKNILFSGTIKENLRWGSENATEEQMKEACRLAQADEFISSFPDGYDTYIEQGGSNVSGGQKQRLCIARALLKQPKILILDDSTSAVDTKTDALIRKGFAEFIPETTKIIIAQRISSVEEADRIVVMDGGRIVDVGSHLELLERCAIYKEVFDSQVKGGNDDE